MSAIVSEWVGLNRDARRVCKEAAKRLTELQPRSPVVEICSAFLHKGVETLTAVNVLYAHRLEQPAQALVRILFEQRINFDCFVTMARDDERGTVTRVFDGMMLEKIKQARASDFAGMTQQLQTALLESETKIASRYGAEDLSRLRKHGFTGLPVEQRATQTGHEDAYNIVYRNFSRNIHATDYVESFMKADLLAGSEGAEYRESRDIAAHYTAHFSAVGMTEIANTAFILGLDDELKTLGERQQQIKRMAGSTAPSG